MAIKEIVKIWNEDQLILENIDFLHIAIFFFSFSCFDFFPTLLIHLHNLFDNIFKYKLLKKGNLIKFGNNSELYKKSYLNFFLKHTY